MLCVLGLLARNGISCGLPLRMCCVCLGYWLGMASPASFSPAFRNHGCSGVINCSVLADKRLRSGTTPVSCLMCAAAQFLKKAIPSHSVYDSKTSVLFLLFTRIVLQSPCKCKFSSPFNCSFQDESPTHCINLFTPKRPNGNLPNMHICA